MVEEIKPEEVKKPSERKDFLKEARELAAENKDTLAKMEALANRIEEATATDLLSGKAPAPSTDKPLEESPQDYSRRVLEGKVEDKE